MSIASRKIKKVKTKRHDSVAPLRALTDQEIKVAHRSYLNSMMAMKNNEGSAKRELDACLCEERELIIQRNRLATKTLLIVEKLYNYSKAGEKLRNSPALRYMKKRMGL